MESLASALGIDRRSDERMVAKAMCRQAGHPTTDGQIPRSVAVWMARLGDDLAEILGAGVTPGTRPQSASRHARVCADDAVRRLSRFEACGVVAFVAPEQVIPTARAADVGRHCRAVLIKHLPDWSQRILHEWASARLFVDADDLDDPDL